MTTHSWCSDDAVEAHRTSEPGEYLSYCSECEVLWVTRLQVRITEGDDRD